MPCQGRTTVLAPAPEQARKHDLNLVHSQTRWNSSYSKLEYTIAAMRRKLWGKKRKRKKCERELEGRKRERERRERRERKR